jgi:hypothetical protein
MPSTLENRGTLPKAYTFPTLERQFSSTVYKPYGHKFAARRQRRQQFGQGRIIAGTPPPNLYTDSIDPSLSYLPFIYPNLQVRWFW